MLNLRKKDILSHLILYLIFNLFFRLVNSMSKKAGFVRCCQTAQHLFQFMCCTQTTENMRTTENRITWDSFKLLHIISSFSSSQTFDDITSLSHLYALWVLRTLFSPNVSRDEIYQIIFYWNLHGGPIYASRKRIKYTSRFSIKIYIKNEFIRWRQDMKFPGCHEIWQVTKFFKVTFEISVKN